MIAILSLENTLENKIFIVKSFSDHRNVRKRGICGHRGQGGFIAGNNAGMKPINRFVSREFAASQRFSPLHGHIHIHHTSNIYAKIPKSNIQYYQQLEKV